MPRQLKITMTKGVAIIRETTEIPLRDDCLLHTDPLTFYCNPGTFSKIAEMDYSGKVNAKKADEKLTEFFLKKANAANIINLCVQPSNLKIVKN